MTTPMQQVSNVHINKMGSHWTYFHNYVLFTIHRRKTRKRQHSEPFGFCTTIYKLLPFGEVFCVGLILPLRLIFKAVNAFWISIVMALSTLPDDSFLWDFCRCNLSELLLNPAFFPQMGQTFMVGFRCCHSIETFPCSF
jgi:hypothetical protein